jgi:hypothetical protein
MCFFRNLTYLLRTARNSLTERARLQYLPTVDDGHPFIVSVCTRGSMWDGPLVPLNLFRNDRRSLDGNKIKICSCVDVCVTSAGNDVELRHSSIGMSRASTSRLRLVANGPYSCGLLANPHTLEFTSCE